MTILWGLHLFQIEMFYIFIIIMFVDIFQEDSVCVVLKGIAEVIRIMNVEIVSLEISVSLFLNMPKTLL